MKFMVWCDEYSVNDERIDSQHQKVIGLINELYNCIQNKTEKGDLARILNELLVYTMVHFTEEEKFLEACEYPNLDAHQKLHANFNEQLKDYRYQFKSGNNKIHMELLTFLRNWWTYHISKEDRMYGGYIAEEKVA